MRRRLDDGADADAVNGLSTRRFLCIGPGTRAAPGCSSAPGPRSTSRTEHSGPPSRIMPRPRGCARLLSARGGAGRAPHAGDWSGKSPLDFAQQQGHAAVAALLRQAAEQRAQRQAAEEAAAAGQAQEDAAAASSRR